MINIESIMKLENNGGMTLVNGKCVQYKTGYQVGICGVEVNNPEECYKAVMNFAGNCGVWLENGIYYIDNSIRVSSKKAALALGRACNQISIYDWKNDTLIYC